VVRERRARVEGVVAVVGAVRRERRVRQRVQIMVALILVWFGRRFGLRGSSIANGFGEWYGGSSSRFPKRKVCGGEVGGEVGNLHVT